MKVYSYMPEAKIDFNVNIDIIWDALKQKTLETICSCQMLLLNHNQVV